MQLAFAFRVTLLEAWAITSVGLVVTGLLFVMGRRWISIPHRSPVPPIKDNTPKPDPFEYGSASERRSALRRGGKPTKVYISEVNKQDELSFGWVIDRSLTGLRLLVPQPVPVDSGLSLHPVDAPQGVPWVGVTVRRCSPWDDHWELGCELCAPHRAACCCCSVSPSQKWIGVDCPGPERRRNRDMG
jgi:hypothetical protein